MMRLLYHYTLYSGYFLLFIYSLEEESLENNFHIINGYHYVYSQTSDPSLILRNNC